MSRGARFERGRLGVRRKLEYYLAEIRREVAKLYNGIYAPKIKCGLRTNVEMLLLNGKI